MKTFSWAAPFENIRSSLVVASIVTGYFFLQTIIRSLLPGGLGLDEAELLVMAQTIEWGYGPQPPLYTYLQKAFFFIFGENKFSLSILKNTLLAITILFIYASSRLCGASYSVAITAGLAIMLIPQFSWESQRDLTHSALAVAFGAVSLWLFMRARTSMVLVDYISLGIVLGLGFISKYNFIFFAFAIFLVIALRSQDRGFRALNTLIATLLVIAPFGWWMWQNPDLVTNKVSKLGLTSHAPLMNAAYGIGALIGATFNYVIIFAGLAVLALYAYRITLSRYKITEKINQRLIKEVVLFLTFALIFLAFTIINSGATNVKDRWLHPILFATPFIAILYFPKLQHINIRIFLQKAIILASVFAMLALPIDKTIGLDKPPRQAAPIGDIAKQISGQGHSIFTLHHWLGGNLRLHDNKFKVLTPDFPHLSIRLDHPVQFVWKASDASAPPPQALIDLYVQRFGKMPELSLPEKITAKYAWPHNGEFIVLRAIAN